MVNRKFSPEFYGAVDELLSQKWSLSVIQKHFQGRGIAISIQQLSKIKRRHKIDAENRPEISKPGPVFPYKPTIEIADGVGLKTKSSDIKGHG